MKGINVALFGLTSTGKSTMLNSLIGSKVAATGCGETTMEITSYPAQGFTLCDIPGRNDEISYFSMQYIAFWKGLTRRLVLITTTVKENTSMMKLLDAIGLTYDVVVNKFDKVDEEERENFQKQVKVQIAEAKLKGVDHVYYVSAKNPKMFDDWIKMVDQMTSYGS
ncbi:unnamed protein product [Rotaria magnacalcarata]|uniref:G domain-containing protein n=1 Tax=Rotaria magnacalcarata TaxID=392030 RepID=A0A816ELI7_9BILA|nr:unnamed protein product [Rotaria magnacalcarata]CAF1648219.1 unnamed protein product [Rotaria magnacalcarata]CAF2133592.1 unnamed protein product [Rotaria magnacalcarata]CAF3793953.1 unnamed protein product [Rotaria magnacalcarata]CAF4113962.1 unnamed protein product [Rotaria magnacalcarata]